MSYLALGIVFALFNVIAFVIPTDKTATDKKGLIAEVTTLLT